MNYIVSSCTTIDKKYPFNSNLHSNADLELPYTPFLPAKDMSFDAFSEAKFKMSVPPKKNTTSIVKSRPLSYTKHMLDGYILHSETRPPNSRNREGIIWKETGLFKTYSKPKTQNTNTAKTINPPPKTINPPPKTINFPPIPVKSPSLAMDKWHQNVDPPSDFNDIPEHHQQIHSDYTINLKTGQVWLKTHNLTTGHVYIMHMGPTKLHARDIEEGLNKTLQQREHQECMPDEFSRNKCLMQMFVQWMSPETENTLKYDSMTFTNVMYALAVYIQDIPEIRPWFDIHIPSDKTVDQVLADWIWRGPEDPFPMLHLLAHYIQASLEPNAVMPLELEDIQPNPA